MKKVVIKITDKQLREAQKDAFEYLTSSDTVPNNGNSEVSVSGKLNDKENGKPATTDKIASMMTVQGYNRYGGVGNTFTRGIMETDDNNHDGIDDFYNNKELDTLSNGDETDNLESISNSADTQTDRFINSIKLLPPKKQAIILNKVIESINLKGISNNWKRELISKLTLAAR